MYCLWSEPNNFYYILFLFIDIMTGLLQSTIIFSPAATSSFQCSTCILHPQLFAGCIPVFLSYSFYPPQISLILEDIYISHHTVPSSYHCFSHVPFFADSTENFFIQYLIRPLNFQKSSAAPHLIPFPLFPQSMLHFHTKLCCRWTFLEILTNIKTYARLLSG